jgi:ATP-binding cassette subfamily C protein CydC
MVASSPWAMARGALLSVTVLLMGVALLGLSGWFITAAGLAGIAGIGIAFDVFRPSAGVRLLALGRAAARYGERLLTHDATLRALVVLRVDMLRRFGGYPYRLLQALRSETALTRIVADVDALDGLVLRLALPVTAAIVTLVVVVGALAMLVDWRVALLVGAGYLVSATTVLLWLARHSFRAAAGQEVGLQRLRRQLIDLFRDREAVIVDGRIAERLKETAELDRRARRHARRTDDADRSAACRLSICGSVIVGGVMLLASWLVQIEDLGPAVAAIAVFVALALTEGMTAMRRGFLEVGRVALAARNIGMPSRDRAIASPSRMTTIVAEAGTPLLRVRNARIGFDIGPGEAIAITGASGAGKSTLLMRIAGLLEADDGVYLVGGKPAADWDEDSLRAMLCVLPQRSALLAGTVRQNLALAMPADDRQMITVLEALRLWKVLEPRGGLDLRLGEGGSGLSGGETRRLCLARVLLRRPRLLLLDEPTEGLDEEAAVHVLDGLRRVLPDCALCVVAHNHIDHVMFDRMIRLDGVT